ncbi:HlyD family efflux transporter periplasmic adaptor subunit [Billgrantia kenyensis]|uniref:HlyD family efflux transporter periplasmic adaptor subunit n=1 Tax=Billgrantia kenyensis TaxID=321266 RepID=A0A7V9VXP7_9GAMM|nr:HlyD family efflux transporter periplasmic adaptor subunit [Halomonas kenyensis]MBA2777287.1 HlyD family efflux transporter periplasmic adaptor subunit [Halomonas kenyensis]MCG6659957.1 HlyD family efflux transporter periplasmic adaptor subunit [Halomonas kenyensis]
MAGPLFSQHWHRVADLRLRLRHHASLQRHEYRGEPWYVLHDSLTGQVHRFTPEAYQIIGRLDGERTLREIWDQASAALGDAMPTQQELIALIGRLHGANVLSGHGDIDIDELSRRQGKQRRGKWLQLIRSPLGIRIPLLDPERFVAASYPFVRPFISPWGGAVWLLTLTLALVVAGMHWQSLTDNLADRVFGVGNLLLLALIYPLIKALHELGHAWATKDAGGEVHEIGVMLLVFFPVPYVDASAAAACPDKGRRMLVGAAGIMVELFLASLAMLVWAVAEPGLLRAVAFNVMLIAGVSTLLFNGNPLLRFDAYYVLADYLEIPNLFNRANQQLTYAVKRYLLGRRDVTGQAGSLREACWLVGYSLASFTYRLFIMVAIAVFVATQYLFIGVILALWSVTMTLLLPLFKLLKAMTVDDSLQGSRRRAWSWMFGALGLVALLLFVVPLPYATHVHGVIDSREPAQVRAGVSGVIAERWVEDGQQVAAGDPLMRIAAPELDVEVQLLEARQREIEQELLASVRDTQARAILRETLVPVERQLDDARQRASATVLSSPHSGLLLMPEGVPALGSHLQRGAAVAVVVRPEDLRVRTLLPAHQVERVRSDTREVRLRLPGHERDAPGELAWVSPSSDHVIPSPVLSVEGGGRVAVDPANRGDDGAPRAFRRHYVGDFSAAGLLASNLPLHLGGRVHVRIEHAPEPVGYRLWRDTRRSFLRLFER